MCAFKGEHLVQTVSYIEITFKDVICTYLYKRLTISAYLYV